MKQQIAVQEVDLPGDVVATLVAFDNGAIRLTLNTSPYVLQECVVGDPVDTVTQVTLSPGGQGSAAQTGKVRSGG